MWAGWLFVVSVILVIGITVMVRRLRERIPVVPPGESGAMNGFAIPISQTALRVAIILFVLPPALLTILWIWQRFGARR
jgi:hypothetical protein